MAHATIDLDLAPDDRTEPATRARTILVQAALLGVLADTTIRAGPAGLGWATLVAGLVLTLVLLAVSLGERITRERAAWLAVAVLAAGASAWRDADELRVLNFFAALGALGVAAMTFAGAPARSVFVARVRDLIWLGRSAAADAAGGTAALMVQAETGGLVAAGSRSALPIVRAALITIPLLAVFGALFTNADPVFGQIFAIPEIAIETVLSHLLLGAFCAWVAGGWLRSALLPARRSAPPEQMPITLGAVEIGTSLGSLNVLFAAFVGLQARWLFGGASIVEATTGLTVAEYARRGFFELVMVAALVAPVILVTRAAITDEATIKRHRVLATSLLVLLGAVMVSAFSRMALYVSYYGLTNDRLYASVFMGWLAIVFAAMGLTVLRGWGKPFTAIAAISGLVVLGALNASNPDAIIARSIVSRGGSAQGIDYSYLSRMSGDALPITAAALVDATPSRDACWAARVAYNRGTVRATGSWNWGASTGRQAAERVVTLPVVQRLCVKESWPPENAR